MPDGGAFDGPLGIVSAFAAIDLLAERGLRLRRPIAVAAFGEEEGARFGVACLGSRLLTGAITPAAARLLTDADGITLPAAMAAAGLDPDAIGPEPDRLAGIAAYVELHIEQGSALAGLGAVVGLAEGIWPHGRWRLEFTGRADHAGTTRIADRRDPMLAFAAAVLAARQAATAHGALATIGKVIAEPGARQRDRLGRPRLARRPGPGRGRAGRAVTAQVTAAAQAAADQQRSRSASPRSRSRRRSSSTRPCATGWPAPWRLAASPPRCWPPARVTTRASWPPGCRPPCCSCATPPACRTPPPSTPTPRTVKPACAPWPPSWPSWPAMAPPAGTRSWLAELAWLPGQGVRAEVLIEAAGGRFTAVTPGAGAGPRAAGATRLPGLTLPGLANAHSHAFHRALRGITQAGPGTFWTWRERMYDVAARLDPDSYLALATGVYAEMALAGVTCVGEFHYLHHGPGGTRYADPNEMGRVLLAAASRAGLRITLLDTCYLSGGLAAGGLPLPLAGPQLRFGDGDADAWAARADALGADPSGALSPVARAGAAIHSVRAVPLDQMHPVVAWSQRLGAPLHTHLSEQVAENEACLAAYRRTPAEVLYEAGVLGPRASVVHATHLAGHDLELIGGSRAYTCLCPTTEADLADGIGPAAALAAAGSPLTVGSDSHAVIDLFDEARRIEQYERLASGERGHFTAAELARAATMDGHASLGWPEAGEITTGALADLVTVSLDSARLAGAAGAAAADGRGPASPATLAASSPAASSPAAGSLATALESVVFAATAADVASVVIGGRDVVRGGRHLLLDDVPGQLAAAIRTVTS